ncbi:hypothetical protein AVEN_58053-1 [Araneus ventricosus]|uniref:Uncharacterized protein n=1 Tax=Araneus ventricosus TaxID=182803 RepID=A0A4Y2WWM9_ARAVE|nr:hypothetical protein AVEN_58053-1 [Araneus ventricosus]
MANLDCVLEFPVLVDAASNMADPHSGILNLVRKDWKKVLHNHPKFQDVSTCRPPFQEATDSKNASVQRLSNVHHLDVVIFGKFSLFYDGNKDHHFITVREGESFTEILKGMTSDLTGVKLSTGRFFVEACSPLYCKPCRETRLENRLPLITKKREWCVLKTKIYNGETIQNVFRSDIENLFRGTVFCGIVHFQISSRYFYTNMQNERECRLSGNCKDMILFKEVNVLPRVDFQLGQIGEIETTREEKSVKMVKGENDYFESMTQHCKRANEHESREFSKKIKNSEEKLIIEGIPTELNRNENDINPLKFDVTLEKFTM